MGGGYFADLFSIARRIAGMRIAPFVLLVALAAACGSAEPASRTERYGISIALPEGWQGQVARGMIRITRGEVSVLLREYEPGFAGEAVYFSDPWPVRLEPTDFGRRADEDDAYLTGVSGRLFSVFPGRSAPSREELTELNEALSTINVRRGDYYPGTVDGLRFPSRSGWDVGGGRGERRPQGEFVTAWAATSPYSDGPDAFPRRTLETLPDDGIVIWIMLSRGGPLAAATAREREKAPPYHLRDLDGRVGWEGQIRDLPEYVLWSTYGDGYLVDLRAYFGRREPSEAMLAEADAMVAGLEFPDWGRWELEAG